MLCSYRQLGVLVTEHRVEVPLHHEDPTAGQLHLFVRELVDARRSGDDLPVLLYLEGGPGMAALRPFPDDGTWLGRALEEFRVLLLDQRGTGRSTPLNRQSLAAFDSADAQAQHLQAFRADSIVEDCELVRRALLGDRRWTLLGQSFGGFCALTYLSRHPEGLNAVLLGGGLPGLNASADNVYRATYPAVAAKTNAHYTRYPQDVGTAHKIAAHLQVQPASLPGGGVLTVERFQSLGQALGFTNGSYELHYLLEEPFSSGQLSDGFLRDVESKLTFTTAPLYALLHEAIYAQGTATRWAAARIRNEFPAFDAAAALASGDPILFTGEMIYPWTFEGDPILAPLRGAAELLAEFDGWPALYDSDRLDANVVPVAAAVYANDMYVPYELSRATAQRIPHLAVWLTSAYEHDGLRTSSGAVFSRLLDMVRGYV